MYKGKYCELKYCDYFDEDTKKCTLSGRTKSKGQNCDE